MEYTTPTLFPLWGELRKYKISSLRPDLTAALSTALIALPQAMAYAFVADLPTSTGIFATIFGTIFTAAFGSSSALISGPTNLVAILLQSGIVDILYTFYPEAVGSTRDAHSMQILLQIVLFVGLFQIIGGIFHLGRLTQFPSRSAIIGYLAAAAAAIAISQCYYFFGIPEVSGHHPLYEQGWLLLSRLDKTHLPTLLLGLVSLILLLFLPKISRRLPSAVIVFVLAAVAAALFNLAPQGARGIFDVLPNEKIEKVTLLSDVGPLYSELPHIAWPIFEWRLLVKILPLAFAIALLSALEVTTIGRRYASLKPPLYSDSQEIYGLGISNFLTAFLGAMPSSGSFSRSVVNVESGAKTRLAAIFSGIFLFIITLALGFLVTKIPLVALSALLLLTAFSMVDYNSLLLCLKATKADTFVVIATFAAGLLFPLDVALYVGILLSIALYFKQVSVPLLVEYTFTSIGKLRPMESGDARPDPRISIVHIEGELFFGAAEELVMKISTLAEEENLQVLILQIINARHIDASICLALQHVDALLRANTRILLISSVSPQVEQVMEKSGLAEVIGRDRLFMSNDRVPSEPTRLAYAYAKKIVSG